MAATSRAIDQQTGPVVLVGHSWAGVVITEAANDPKVKALVYVAAFAPDNGHLLMIYLKVSRPPNGHPNCRRIRADFCDCRRTGIFPAGPGMAKSSVLETDSDPYLSAARTPVIRRVAIIFFFINPRSPADIH